MDGGRADGTPPGDVVPDPGVRAVGDVAGFGGVAVPVVVGWPGVPVAESGDGAGVGLRLAVGLDDGLGEAQPKWAPEEVA